MKRSDLSLGVGPHSSESSDEVDDDEVVVDDEADGDETEGYDNRLNKSSPSSGPLP